MIGLERVQDCFNTVLWCFYMAVGVKGALILHILEAQVYVYIYIYIYIFTDTDIDIDISFVTVFVHQGLRFRGLVGFGCGFRVQISNCIRVWG